MRRLMLMFVFAACAVESVTACTAIIVGKKASATGRVLIGHNEDGSGLVMRHAMLPRRDGRAAAFWSEVKRPAGNEQVAHFFYNEHGVLVVSNNGGVMNKWGDETFQLPDEGAASRLTDGGLGYDLRVRAIATAKTARACVDKMAELVETYGYNQNSRNFMVADADEAWVFMALRGRRYVARRVPDDEVTVYPNCLIFNKLRPGDLASKSIAAQGADLDVIARYQGPRTWKSPYNIHRWLDLYRIATGVELAVGDEYPFSVRPAHPVSADDVKRGLSSHYEGRPYEANPRHPAGGPVNIQPLCRQTTLESLVCELGAKPSETVIQLTVGRPCEVPYETIRPFAGTFPADTVFGKKAEERLDQHVKPMPDRVRVALYVGTGVRSNGCVEWMRLANGSPDLELTLVDVESICAGALKKADLIVVPGGASTAVRKALAEKGAEAIRDFVRNGGGYIGTCAGCCLALDEKADPARGIGLIPYHRVGNKSHGMMPVAINAQGAAALGLAEGTREIRYSKGPVMVPVAPTDEMKFETWGTFAGDLVDDKADFAMRDKVAIVGGTFGKGRVFAIACHPESFTCTRDIVRGAFRFVAGREVTFPERVRPPRALSVGFVSPVIAGITTAQAVLQLEARADVDLFPLAADEMRFNMLDHVDVVLLPDGDPGAYKKLAKTLTPALAAFVSRGGRVIGWGAGTRFLPPGGTSCTDSTAAIAQLDHWDNGHPAR